jgi:hypothetical protein
VGVRLRYRLRQIPEYLDGTLDKENPSLLADRGILVGNQAMQEMLRLHKRLSENQRLSRDLEDAVLNKTGRKATVWVSLNLVELSVEKSRRPDRTGKELVAGRLTLHRIAGGEFSSEELFSCLKNRIIESKIKY